MTRLAVLLVLTCGPAVCAAQEAAGAQAPPGVAVRSFEWRPLHRNVRQDDTGLRRSGDSARNAPVNPERRDRDRGLPGRTPGGHDGRLEMPSPPVRPARRGFYGYESSLHLKNNGAKAITAVEWEHVFFSDKEKLKELRRFSFRKETKVAPGEQKFVAQTVPSERYSGLTPKPRQSVVINRVEYSDGSAWQRQ